MFIGFLIIVSIETGSVEPNQIRIRVESEEFSTRNYAVLFIKTQNRSNPNRFQSESQLTWFEFTYLRIRSMNKKYFIAKMDHANRL